MFSDSVDGKHIFFSEETPFIIQIKKNKNKYINFYSILGNLDLAIMYYRGINLSLGEEKRLIMVNSKHILLKDRF
jgi:hypothetical protein